MCSQKNTYLCTQITTNKLIYMDNYPQNYNQHNPQKSRQPQTIEELRQWYVKHNLPPEEVTRFFIGRDISEPKAFGIYKNERGECVVYKNKASGERAVRYQGTDEAYAVGELLLKLKSEIVIRKEKKQGKNQKQSPRLSFDGSSRQSSYSRSSRMSGTSAANPASDDGIFGKNTKKKGCIGTIVAIFGAIVMALFGGSVPNGYYSYQGSNYYHQNSSWYRYNPASDSWSQTQSLDEFINKDNANQYRIGGIVGKRFEDTEWYDDGRYNWNENDSWDDDDNDYYWDDDDDDGGGGGGWDDDDTDWDSDW